MLPDHEHAQEQELGVSEASSAVPHVVPAARSYVRVAGVARISHRLQRLGLAWMSGETKIHIGGVLYARHPLDQSLWTQATIALSSGEAEYYSMVKAASEALGLQAMAQDFGVPDESLLIC